MVFPCSPGGPDDYVMIHPRGDGWDLTLAAIGRTDLIGDPRFDEDEKRYEHSEEVTQILTDWTSKRTKWEAMDALASSGVLASAVVGATEVLDNEQLIAREMIVEVDDPVRGDYKMIGIPVKMTDDPNVVTRAPRYSEHTDEVLTKVLGCTEEQVAEMRAAGVVV